MSAEHMSNPTLIGQEIEHDAAAPRSVIAWRPDSTTPLGYGQPVEIERGVGYVKIITPGANGGRFEKASLHRLKALVDEALALERAAARTPPATTGSLK
jgi:hypothetical protein